MSIDWLRFTPGASLAGGLLIGLAASGLILISGRIAGISGILGGIFGRDAGWRLAFQGGLIAAPLVWRVFAALPGSRIDASWPVLITAGLLAGLGTRYGAGCTSGHGIRGLSRLSPRSLAAVVSFMVAGFATVFVMRHLVAA